MSAQERNRVELTFRAGMNTIQYSTYDMNSDTDWNECKQTRSKAKHIQETTAETKTQHINSACSTRLVKPIPLDYLSVCVFFSCSHQVAAAARSRKIN